MTIKLHVHTVLAHDANPATFVLFSCRCDGTRCDYPDIGADVGARVVRGEAARGIVVCGTGITAIPELRRAVIGVVPERNAIALGFAVLPRMPPEPQWQA